MFPCVEMQVLCFLKDFMMRSQESIMFLAWLHEWWGSREEIALFESLFLIDFLDGMAIYMYEVTLFLVPCIVWFYLSIFI